MKISENFTREEFDCKDGTKYPKDWIEVRLKTLCDQLEIIRKEIKQPLHILSGYRTKEHNKKVGGKSNSKHLEGIAADITVKGITGSYLGKLIEQMIKNEEISDGGLGIYKNFVHYDLRLKPSRWFG